MLDIFQIIQLVLSVLIVPALGYLIRLERRITKLETMIEMCAHGQAKCAKEEL